MWKDAWAILIETSQFIRRHAAALAPWAVRVVAASWVADISAVVVKAGEGAKAFQVEPLSVSRAARAFGWAVDSSVQPGQGISPPWELVPAMTNPFLLLGVANLLEISLAIVSAVLIHNYLLRAARPLRSRKWLESAPSAVLVLAAALLWFRLYGPLTDLMAVTFGVMLPESSAFIWQVLAWFVFAPFMLTVYLMILGRLETKQAASASVRLLRDNWRSASVLILIALVFFLGQTSVVRFVPATSPIFALPLALVSTLIRVSLGFWLATVWLLWVDSKYTPKTAPR